MQMIRFAKPLCHETPLGCCGPCRGMGAAEERQLPWGLLGVLGLLALGGAYLMHRSAR